MGSVRKRTWESGGETKTAWVADYFDQSGTRRLKTFKTKKEADAELVRIQHEVRQGTHTPESVSISVAQAAELWLRRCEIEELERSTLKQYRNHVRHHIAPLIGSAKLAR